MTVRSSIAVIGAGVVGLSTARALQRRGVAVEVFDTSGPGSGATRGNAGWVTPGLVEPLGSPTALRQGLTAAIRPNSPVAVRTVSPTMIGFLARLMRNSSRRRYSTGVASLGPLASHAIDAYDELGDLAPLHRTPILSVFSSLAECDRFISGHRHHPVDVEQVGLDEAAHRVPMLSSWVQAAASIKDQAFVDPERMAAALADAITRDGGAIRAARRVTHVEQGRTGTFVHNELGERRQFDAVVIAAGAQSGALLAEHGVRTQVVAGRGYSFSTMPGRAPACPVYIPEYRLACTPLAGALRIVGVMEFDRHGAQMDRRHIDAMRNSARKVFGNEVDVIAHPWVGSRPCTADGLPLLGPTRSKDIYAAVGHGMWGITLGPVSGEFLARKIMGEAVPELAPFDPLRASR